MTTTIVVDHLRRGLDDFLMGISLYFSAKRKTALTPSERAEVDALLARYRARADELAPKVGRPWEGISVEEEAPYVLSGSAGLPMSTEQQMGHALRHWVELLARIRGVVLSAEWHVHVDDHDLEWNEQRQAYVLD